MSSELFSRFFSSLKIIFPLLAQFCERRITKIFSGKLKFSLNEKKNE